MKILAFECSTATASVAVSDNGRILGESSIEASRRHTEQLLPMADVLLSSLGLTLDDISAFACSIGPGSFTGVRIGAATVKGLAFGSGKPCVGTSSLTSLAYCHADAENGTLICPVIGCRRGNVYNSLFELRDGNPIRLCDDRMISCTELAEELISLGKPVTLCGDETAAISALCSDDLIIPTARSPLPSAVGVALLADKLLHDRADCADHTRDDCDCTDNEHTYNKHTDNFCAAHTHTDNDRFDGDRADSAMSADEYTDLTLFPDYFRPCQAERERLGMGD